MACRHCADMADTVPSVILSGVDVFTGSQWNAVGRIGSGCRSSAAFPALGRAADAQKRVPTTTCLHLRASVISVLSVAKKLEMQSRPISNVAFSPERIGMRSVGPTETAAPETISRTRTDGGRAEARPYHTKPTSESRRDLRVRCGKKLETV
jgi:hypothetical protein